MLGAGIGVALGFAVGRRRAITVATGVVGARLVGRDGTAGVGEALLSARKSQLDSPRISKAASNQYMPQGLLVVCLIIALIKATMRPTVSELVAHSSADRPARGIRLQCYATLSVQLSCRHKLER